MKGWLAAAAAATVVAGMATLGPAATAQTVQFYDDGNVAQVFKAIGFGGKLGVSVRDIEEADLKSGKGPTQGIIVEDVGDDSPAQKAGIKKGDVIVEFDGERVRSTRQFTRLVQESTTGRPVPMAVMRDGQRVSLNVERRVDEPFRYFDELVRTPKAAVKINPPALMMPKIESLVGGARLGIGIQDLSTQLAEYFGTKDGVLVTSVTDNSNASKAGLKAGDVITSFDGQTVNSTSELTRRAQRLNNGDDFTIAVIRDKKALTLKGKMDLPQQRRSVISRTVI
jgi:serine protease Do